MEVAKDMNDLRFMITENGIPIQDACLWLDLVSVNSYLTGERFLEQQFSSLQLKFLEAKKKDTNLPSEFINNDSSRRHYIVVAGRREHYETNPDYSYSIRRYEAKSARIKLLHYDNLIDLTQILVGKNTF